MQQAPIANTNSLVRTIAPQTSKSILSGQESGDGTPIAEGSDDRQIIFSAATRPPSPPTNSSETSLQRTAANLSIDDSFWTVYLPYNDDDVGKVSGLFAGMHAAPWSSVVRDLARVDETVRVALTALALSNLANVNGDVAMRREATRLYGQALQRTNWALSRNIETASGIGVLATCRVRNASRSPFSV